MRKIHSFLVAVLSSTILVTLIQCLSPLAQGADVPIILKPQASEAVSIPSIPSGLNIGTVGTRYTYSTGGSFSNLGHPVQYFFDWGDGTSSGWLPAGITTASKSWSSAATYSIRVRARCATDASAVSSWSVTKIVMM